MSGPVRDIPYNQTQQLDLYPAEQPGQPLVVCIHGGGFVSGSRRDERCRQSAAIVQSAGYNLASIGYSLAPEGDRFACWPRNICDVADAIAFLHDHAERFAYDFARLGMIGFSAGCCLSNLYIHGGRRLLGHYGHRADVFPVSALVGFYGPFDFTIRQEERKSRNPEINRLHSPAYWMRQYPAEQAPPVLHFQGERDEIVFPDQHRAFQRDYRDRGFSFTPVILEGFGHSFAPRDFSEVGQPVDLGPRIVDFFKQNL